MRGCRPFTGDECERISRELGRGRFGARNQAIFWLGISTAFRISELLALRVRDVWAGDPEDGQVLDDAFLPRGRSKGKIQGRTGIINDRAERQLRKWVGQLAAIRRSSPVLPNDAIFQGQNGSRKHKYSICREHFWEILKRACDRARVYGNIGTHSMRKTFAHWYYEACGRDIVETADALGHSDIRTTLRYLGVNEKKRRKLVNEFGKRRRK